MFNYMDRPIHGSGQYFIGFDFLAKLWLDCLPEPDQKMAIFHIAMFAANRQISYYAPPDDFPRVKLDMDGLGRLALMRAPRLKETLPLIEEHLERRGDYLYLPDGQWLLKSGGGYRRRALPHYLRREIVERDGERCVYCGNVDGPFDIDHIFPVVRGGSDAANNLVVACAPCNRSKGDKTLKEWREWQSDLVVEIA